LSKIKEYFFLFKVHHWIKNLSIFLPVIASHSYLNLSTIACLVHFINFSILASIIYLINNVSDYKADIINKKLRYKLNLDRKKYYYYLSTLAILIQIFVLYVFSRDVLIICIFYVLLSITYNQFLKNHKYFDVLTISIFHILRIYYGAVVFEITLSFYFILFCFSIFLMIGLNKRIIEIQKNFTNRPYNLNDKKRLNFLQVLFGILAVLTFLFYCIDPLTSQYFLNQSFLYLNSILIILIIGNYLYFQRNMNQDIIVFIYKNKINLVLVSSFFIIFIKNSAFF
jgi:4-hydroxybenzoate polyprenyltransferase